MRESFNFSEKPGIGAMSEVVDVVIEHEVLAVHATPVHIQVDTSPHDSTEDIGSDLGSNTQKTYKDGQDDIEKAITPSRTSMGIGTITSRRTDPWLKGDFSTMPGPFSGSPASTVTYLTRHDFGSKTFDTGLHNELTEHYRAVRNLVETKLHSTCTVCDRGIGIVIDDVIAHYEREDHS